MSKLTTKTVAERMGVTEQFVRCGIQQGILPFGCAVKVGKTRYTYYINPVRFEEYLGGGIKNEA